MAFGASTTIRIDSPINEEGTGVDTQQQQQEEQKLTNGFGNSAANNSNSFGQVRFNGDSMEVANNKSASASSKGKAVDSGSILGSAKNPNSKQPEKPTMESVVNLPGFGETDIATAMHLGFIEYDGSTGGFKELSQDQQQTPSNPQAEAKAQESQEQQNAWKDNPVDRESRKVFDEFDMVYGEEFTDSVIATAINEMAKGADNIDTSKFNEYANRAQVDPGEMLQKVEKIVGGFQDQAVRYMQRNNPDVDGKEVINWLISGEVSEDNVREIFNQHIHHKNLKVYDNVVKAFKNNRG